MCVKCCGELTWVFEVEMVSEGFGCFGIKKRGFWIFGVIGLVQVDENTFWSN